MPRPLKAPRLYTKELSAIVRIQRMGEVDGRINDVQRLTLILSLNKVAAILQTAQEKGQ